MALDGKIVVYTSITGNKDFLKDEQTGDCEFIIYTDNLSLQSKKWHIKKANDLFKDNIRNAKIHKILAHQYLDCEYSIWIDGNVYLKTEPKELIEKYLKDYDMAVFKHHEGRTCIYQEHKICHERKLDDRSLMKEQIDRYRDNGYPENNGLYECTVILRKHNKRTEEFNNLWWSEISRFSKRDQLSFNWCLSKTKLRINEMKGTLKDNKDFRRIPHQTKDVSTVYKPRINKLVPRGDVEVIMNVSTNYSGIPLISGSKINVPRNIGERWVSRGLASFYNWEEVKKTLKPINGPVHIEFGEHPKVSIVIPIKDQTKYTKMCIDSIRKYTKDYELILIDNESDIETKEYLESLKNVKLLRNKENKGIPYSWNQGIKLAKHDYVCFLNNDCIVTRDWLEKLMKTFEVNKDAGIVGPTTSYSGSEQCNQTIMRYRHIMSEQEMNDFAESLKEGYKPVKIQGFCYIVKAELFDLVGGFNHERFKIGNTEENEFTWRVEHMTEFKAYWCKGAYVHHFGHLTFNGLQINPFKYNKVERDKWEREKHTAKCEKFDISEVSIEEKITV